MLSVFCIVLHIWMELQSHTKSRRVFGRDLLDLSDFFKIISTSTSRKKKYALHAHVVCIILHVRVMHIFFSNFFGTPDYSLHE